MPIRGVGESLEEQRWIVSARWIPSIEAERARQRTTAMVRLHPALQVGIELNPVADRVGALANLRLVEETGRRPALLVGTSSDRIGTEEGQAYYGTLSKHLGEPLGIPVAPYVGATWNDRDYEWRELAGLNWHGGPFSITHIWDGENLHHTFDVGLGQATVGAILVDLEDSTHLGFSIGARF